MTAPLYNLTDTWANGATVFTAILMNVTDTASDASSLLMDLQVGGVSQFHVTKAGQAQPKSFFIIDAGTVGGNGTWGSSNGLAGQTFVLAGSYFGINGSGSVDVRMYSDAPNIFAQRNGVNAQTFRAYGTYTDGANYERLALDAEAGTASAMRLRSEAAGTGTIRIIAIDGFSKAGAAANTDIPTGTWALIHDTSGATTKLVYNNGGTLQTVALT